MIISHEHKFIFTKPQKTAGTSIELLLSRICGSDDVITPLGFDPDPEVRQKNGASAPQNYRRPKPLKTWELRELYWLLREGRKPHLNYWEHLPADSIKEYVGDDTWNSYLKISVVRNPWDHAVSWFKWQSKYNFEQTQGMRFEDYLRSKYRSLWPYYSVKGLYDIDFMIRFEHLQEDLKMLSNHLPDLDYASLPVTKKSSSRKKSFHNFYETEEMVEMVRARNLNVLEHFDYSFDHYKKLKVSP